MRLELITGEEKATKSSGFLPAASPQDPVLYLREND
jgi:hypothetical protein